MSGKNKSYNSIIFLTTLSVYLGLVLVSGSSPVLAYSALTKEFDIRNELEFNEDLEKKPDDTEVNSFLAFEPEKAIAQFIEDLKNLKQSGQKISNKYIEYGCSHSWQSADIANASITVGQKQSNVDDFLREIWKRYETSVVRNSYDSLPPFFKKGHKDQIGKSFSHKYSFGKQGFRINFKFTHGSESEAKVFSDNLNRAFAQAAAKAKDKVTKATYENTKAITSDGYVNVVTNLPRASIDSLLKQ